MIQVLTIGVHYNIQGSEFQKGSCPASVWSFWFKRFEEEILKKICSHTSISVFGNALFIWDTFSPRQSVHLSVPCTNTGAPRRHQSSFPPTPQFPAHRPHQASVQLTSFHKIVGPQRNSLTGLFRSSKPRGQTLMVWTHLCVQGPFQTHCHSLYHSNP